MKSASLMFIPALTMAISAVAGDGVGVNADAVTVPVESITVAEASLRPVSSDKILEIALSSASEEERLGAVYADSKDREVKSVHPSVLSISRRTSAY